MKTIFFCLPLLMSVSVVKSQDTLLVTFDEAIRIALQNNVVLNQQKNQFEFNQQQKQSSIASLGPNVSAFAQATQFNGNSFNQQQGRAVNGIRDNVNASLNAGLTLFNGNSRISTLKAANNQLDAQGYFVKRTSEDVINNVATQYLQVLLDIELHRIAKQNHETQLLQLEQVKGQVEVGTRPIVDQLNQEAQTSNAELRVLQADITINNDKAILTSLLLLDPFNSVTVARPSWSLDELMNDNRDHITLYELAKVNRGDVQRAISQEKASRYLMHATRASMTPTLSAFFSYGTSYNFQHNVPDSVTARDPSINRPFGSQFSSDNIYKSYGLQLSIPIFNGLQNKTNYYQQKIVYKNSQLTTSNVEIQAKTDVLRTHRNFQLQKKTLIVSQSQLKAAEEAFLLETERYNLGVTNFVDYQRANVAYIQAKTDLAQAEYRLLFQRILLAYATGTLRSEIEK
jgi:outer membrane protein